MQRDKIRDLVLFLLHQVGVQSIYPYVSGWQRTTCSLKHCNDFSYYTVVRSD